MPRGKVKIQWIVNNTKRRATMKKRLPGLVKKISELAILCDIPACLVVYQPDEEQPVVWPSTREATNIVQKYYDLPESKKLKKRLDAEGFQQQQVDKEKAELFNAHRDNCDQEINLIMKQFIAHRRHSFEDLATEVLIHLKLKVKESLKAIDTRLQKIHFGGI